MIFVINYKVLVIKFKKRLMIFVIISNIFDIFVFLLIKIVVIIDIINKMRSIIIKIIFKFNIKL